MVKQLYADGRQSTQITTSLSAFSLNLWFLHFIQPLSYMAFVHVGPMISSIAFLEFTGDSHLSFSPVKNIIYVYSTNTYIIYISSDF